MSNRKVQDQSRLTCQILSYRRGTTSDLRKLNRLFWDRGLRKRDLEEYPLWVLERVLEHGSLEDVRIIAARMGHKWFLDNVAQVRFQTAKAENFIAMPETGRTYELSR
jgi:hypothetical protein